MKNALDATIDPVCGMTVDPKTALSSEWNGQRIHFCNPSCKRKFDANPAAYREKSPTTSPAQPESAGGAWTCPMHPEVRASKPGPCPKCGMALGPASS